MAAHRGKPRINSRFMAPCQTALPRALRGFVWQQISDGGNSHQPIPSRPIVRLGFHVPAGRGTRGSSSG